ncbi:5-oxoprolinase subunit PxpB [Desulfocastanea catecholica]
MEFGEGISPHIHQRIKAMLLVLEGLTINGIVEYLPAYRSITFIYNPLLISFGQLQDKLVDLYQKVGESSLPAPQIIELPVCYGGEFGPDLAYVAKSHSLSEKDVILLHSQPDYFVYMLGFSPGFPFLGGLPETLHTPRQESPRKKVPAGSVGIANGQTGVYPVDSPGGWQLIGRTPMKLFDEKRDDPFLLAAGNILKFKPVSEKEYYSITREG